jgi:hypothetical protein
VKLVIYVSLESAPLVFITEVRELFRKAHPLVAEAQYKLSVVTRHRPPSPLLGHLFHSIILCSVEDKVAYLVQWHNACY